MNLEKKLKLMKKYDFDFISKLTNLDNYVFFLTREGNTKNDGESHIAVINRNYGQISGWYAQIDFEGIKREIDKGDAEDFATLFNVRELLPKLRQALDEYITFARNHQYHVPENESLHQRIISYTNQMCRLDAHNSVRYRDRIRNYENQLQN